MVSGNSLIETRNRLDEIRAKISFMSEAALAMFEKETKAHTGEAVAFGALLIFDSIDKEFEEVIYEIDRETSSIEFK